MVSKFSHFSFETCYCNLFRIQPDRCFITFFLVVVVAKKKELHFVHSFSFSFFFVFFVILIFLESAYFSVEMQRTSIVAQKDFWAKSCQWQLHHFSTARTGTTTTKQNSNLWNKSQNLLLISYISLPRPRFSSNPPFILSRHPLKNVRLLCLTTNPSSFQFFSSSKENSLFRKGFYSDCSTKPTLKTEFIIVK